MTTPQPRLIENDRYLRNRPFLVVRMTDLGMKQKSFREMVMRVQSKHEREADIILDVINMRIIKNSTDANDSEAMVFLRETYGDDLSAAIKEFLKYRAAQLISQGFAFDDLDLQLPADAIAHIEAMESDETDEAEQPAGNGDE